MPTRGPVPAGQDVPVPGGGAWARPGIEPGPPVLAGYGIVETGWFDLGRPAPWGEAVSQDAITGPLLWRMRTALGYTSGG